MADDLIGTAELARELGVSPQTIYRRVKDGTIKPAMTAPGGQHGTWLFRRPDKTSPTKETTR